MKKTDYHEEETVSLKAVRPVARVALDKWLRDRGYRSEDDFYYLERTDHCEPWQTSTLVTLDVLRAGHGVYETEDDLTEGLGTDWDELRAAYLLASMPRDCIVHLIREVGSLATEFGLEIEYRGNVVSANELTECLEAIADRLSEEWADPGSKILMILIEDQYGSP